MTALPAPVSVSRRFVWTSAAFVIYVTAIVLSNWLITHVGIPAGPGTHLTQVGFGLLAPSGVWAAGVSFPARDVVQRTGGRWLGIAAIILGAAISWRISSPVIAVASGGTYLISESLDMAVYSRLQRRWFLAGVTVSSLIAAAVDSLVFLRWAGLPAGWAAWGGLFVGKTWMILAAFPVVWALRKRGPMAVQA
jgi:queuosine precursor transporter